MGNFVERTRSAFSAIQRSNLRLYGLVLSFFALAGFFLAYPVFIFFFAYFFRHYSGTGVHLGFLPAAESKWIEAFSSTPKGLDWITMFPGLVGVAAGLIAGVVVCARIHRDDSM